MKDCTKNKNWKIAHKKSHDTVKTKAIKFRRVYDTSPKLCKECGIGILFEKRRNDFCSHSCAMSCVNRRNPKRKLVAVKNECLIKINKFPRAPSVLTIRCNHCKNHFDVYAHGRNRKYCNRKCESQHKKDLVIDSWKAGLTSGLGTGGTVTNPVKRYLREKYGDKCCVCGWSKVNPHTGKVPLVADHIDGNYLNNIEDNLRLICWNCDAIGSTFGGANRGNGRKNRKR